MGMPVMNVRPMHVIVNNRLVSVRMIVRFSKRIGMAMVMIGVPVRVDMTMRDLLVRMFVRMPFID